MSAAAANLLDRRYRDHLDGINRVGGVDIGTGERLFGAGRSLSAGIRFSW